ncbi:hypothetical protein UPYG_G00161380 [Umbra pygmaea]|uniref:Cell growth-regulating nucleolar protein n=1 Tax=Umbra pygmaea TaxID=75934 RepID=A0ABD0WRE8_UMBPY
MVFFTCNACGESLKKAKVESHVFRCRGCSILSCIDCGKEFWGNDYMNHVKCITENQKYGGKSYEAKACKGEVKQQQWIQVIQEAMNKPGISANLKDVLDQLSSYDNIPRKKEKFQNWMKNSLKIYSPVLQDQVWAICSAATHNTSPEVPKQTGEPKNSVAEVKANGSQPLGQNGASEELEPEKKKLNKRERKEARQKKSGKKEKKSPENGNADEGDSGAGQQKGRKRKRGTVEAAEEYGSDGESDTTTKKSKTSKKDHSKDDQNTENADEEAEGTGEKSDSKGKFNWKGTIKAVLRQSPEEGISVKRLRKKVLSAYYSFSAEENFKSEEDLLALFNKKIKGNPKFRVLKDKVRLIK